MPEIPQVRIPEIREVVPLDLPSGPPVVLQLGMPVVEMPGCVPVHPDAKLNPRLLQDDPGRTGNFCPEGQLPSFNPMDYTPNEFQLIRPSVPKADDKDDEPERPEPPAIPRIPNASAPAPKKSEVQEVSKPIIEKVVEGLPSVQAVTTTTAIALVASTAALVAKPLSELILKLIKPTVKKLVKKSAEIRGKTVPLESVWQRRLAQRDRNRALRALRRALKP